MKTKALTAAQIDTLAQRLSETTIKPSASAKKAGDNFARLLAARIGDERAALAFTSIMMADTADQAEARLTLVLDYGNPDPAGEPITTADEEPKAAPAPVVGKRQAILDQAQTGALPQVPDFSKPTHARFRAKLAQIVTGLVAVWCRSFDSVMCSKGDEAWAQSGRMNFARMRCGSR